MNSCGYRLRSFLIGHATFAALLMVSMFGAGLVPFITAPLHAQNARIVHKIEKLGKTAPVMGRDLWLALPQNYLDQSGKYFFLYVTSPKATTVHVESSLGTQVNTVQAYKVASFNLSLGWEIKTNNVIENKAIHVYSKDADLTVYLMSHNPYTSDGMYVMPTIAWGTDYVVAAYAALDAGGGDGDEPSEFVLVADQDNTQITFTCPNPLRATGNASGVAYQAGQTVNVTLMRGQCVQYKSVQGIDVEREDVTGTVIHSNVPIGVIGASQCPDIPLGYPYCDHVLDMMPPTRTWAPTYYTAPSANRLKGDTFLLLGTYDGQKVYTTDAFAGKHQVAILNKNQPFWVMDQEVAARWESDKPFFLTQYLNSSTYDCPSCGFGDPAEVVINPVEQYSKTVVFQTPTSQGSQSPYTNYVNLIVNHVAEANTKFDGQNINNFPKLPVDGIYDIYRLSNIKPGTHMVVSDSGAGVYIYGYGSYESYAWTGSFGTGTYNSPDTIPPLAVTSGECFDAHVALSDSEIDASKLGYIRIDTSYNMAFFGDPNWIEGSGLPLSYYDMFVLDSTQPAELKVSIFDLAGNQTSVTSTYIPQVATIGPVVQNFGVGSTAGPQVIRYDTIKNIGQAPFNFNTLKLKLGNQGFTIDSADKSPIPVGGVRIIKLGFQPNPSNTSTVIDSLIFGDPCIIQEVALLGNGGAPDFTVTDDNFDCIAFGDSITNLKLSIINPSPVDVHIARITIDSSEFTYNPSNNPKYALPLLVKAQSSVQVPVQFKPIYTNTVVSAGHFFAQEANIGERDDSLRACVLVPGEEFFEDTTITVDCAAPGDTIPLSFFVKATGSSFSKVTESHTNTTQFANFHATLQGSGTLLNPATPQQLAPSQVLTVSEDFPVPTGVNGTFVDTLIAYDASGATPKIVQVITATIVTNFRAQSVSANSITFAPVPYKSALRPTQQFTITDTTSSDLTINSVDFMAGGNYNSSFGLSFSVNATTVTLPVTLHSGDALVVTVQFDPTQSYDATQTAQIGINSNACNIAESIPVVAKTIVSGATIQGYASKPILACTQQDSNIVVYNLKPAGITDTIVSATIVGADAANFTLGSIIGDTISAGQNLNLPVTFTPTPKAGSTTYNAQVIIELRSQRSDTTLTQAITGTGVSVLATATSIFATQDRTSTANSTVQLPISFNLNKYALTEPIADLKVTAIRLTYIYDADLLNFKGSNPNDSTATKNAIINSITNLPSGWSIDRTNTYLNGDTLVLVLTNPNYLNEQVTSLGTIDFQVVLPKLDSATQVTLASMDLLSGSSAAYTPVEGCVQDSVLGTNFSLIYQCGDKTLQEIMNGDNTFAGIAPAVPNPVTGSSMTLNYANRGESNITISIYDVLGHEVLRPVDNVRHDAGAWQVAVDVSKLPSGTYTYRMVAGPWVASRQFVVQR
jgi:hypothetical protein